MRLSSRAKAILIGLAVLISLFKFVDWLAEYLWFEALAYESVFWRIRLLKVGFFLAAFISVFLHFWVNFRIFAALLDIRSLVHTLTSHAGFHSVTADFITSSFEQNAGTEDAGNRMPGALLLLALAIALVFGLIHYGEWDTLLLYWWAEPYGQADPIYGRDIGFYLFELPLYELLQNSLIAASLITSVVLLFGYIRGGILTISWRQGPEAPPRVLWHVLSNMVLFLVALAWGFYLNRFAILQSTRGAVYGAGYTDVNVLLPGIWIMMGATVGLAAIYLFSKSMRGGPVVLLVSSGYLVVYFLSVVVVPAAVQSLVVAPNELELETPYLKHNIAFTRKAYQLDRVEERSYGAMNEINSAALARNKETIDNIRLWDWRPLSETFRQIQQIRAYYEFSDVDVDRYRIGDTTRQVMLAPRELSDRLPGKADRWVNKRLQFTHGYGLAMSLTAKKAKEGGPIFVIKDIPPRSEVGLTVSNPAIYYGETMSGYQIVSTSISEFDYPHGDKNVYVSYRGTGGVPLNSFWKRLLFSWHQLDINILITSYVGPRSRIQFWRPIMERVERVAPFLRLDRDPYLVVSEGRLLWIQDAYTVSSMFPYSEPSAAGFNYIRNSVKVVVDAYDGSLIFYVIDHEDPVLGVYRRSMPALFKPLDEMPEDLRRHLRYPQDLFQAQVEKYNTYHMTVPQVFYNAEDLWMAPREKYGGEVIQMQPYYVLMKLPNEDRLQFLLMTPLTPANRANMIAWMAARNDFPDYGQLIVYKLSKERLILGPMQVEAKIDQDTLISQRLSLWDQRGSRVIRGNLLVIPIEQSFLYVEPVYLIAEDSAIPQLKRIIVSDGERVAMKPSLEEAISVVFGTGEQPLADTTVLVDADQSPQARAALKAAEDALRIGDWEGFGKAMNMLKSLLGEQ